MRKIDYYIAASLDGFICGPEEDISGFNPQQESKGVAKYLKDLEDYDTVIMGRKTYEFGYKFGLKPGDLAYPHMEHYVFSNNMKIESSNEKLHVCKLDLEIIDKIKKEEGTNIYLCGGGQFANWLLKTRKIDRLIIKLNPFIQGSGTKLFSAAKEIYEMNLVENEVFDGGLMINTYEVNYN